MLFYTTNTILPHPATRYVDFDVYEPCYEYAIFSYFNTAMR